MTAEEITKVVNGLSEAVRGEVRRIVEQEVNILIESRVRYQAERFVESELRQLIRNRIEDAVQIHVNFK